MKKIVSVTIGLLFVTALAVNASAGMGGEKNHSLPTETVSPKMNAVDPLKVKEQVRQQEEQHLQINKKDEAGQEGSKERVRKEY
ncbi:MAG: hypothetical protein KQH63_12155 [Desulfobulbaceae bacterium]|nr:hypothetical protein [Desulfobulbaceae bacterium]